MGEDGIPASHEPIMKVTGDETWSSGTVDVVETGVE
jgi:hypothetical protein